MSIDVMETTRTVVETSQVLKCDGCGAICTRVNGFDNRFPPEPPDEWFSIWTGSWPGSGHPTAFAPKHACSIECARKVLA